MENFKTCTKCNIEKPFSDFAKGRNQCKTCIKEYNKEWREANKEKQKEYREANKERRKEYNKEWREANKEYNKEYRKEYREANKEKLKEYYESNKEKIKEQKKEYYESNKKKIKEKIKEYYEANKDRRKEYNKEWREANKDRMNEHRKKWSKANKEYIKNRRKTDPLFKFKYSVRSNIRQSFKRRGFTKRSKTFNILDCSWEFFRDYIQDQFVEGMSFDNYGEWHLDHVIPLSVANTEEEVLELCRWDNYQPLWAKDNLEKSDKL